MLNEDEDWDEKTVCWWHMTDGAVLGVHDGMVIECRATNTPFSTGDCVLVSIEGSLPTILARGGVVGVSSDSISIILRGASAKPLPATLRIDSDGGATSSKSAKAALVELLTSANSVRDLVVGLKEPAFDAAAGQRWLERVFNDAAWAPPRWGGAGTAALSLRDGFAALNAEQQTACRLVLAAKAASASTLSTPSPSSLSLQTRRPSTRKQSRGMRWSTPQTASM
mgnify:CR=1 FL=1